MKRISFKNLYVIIAICLFYVALAYAVFKIYPWPVHAYFMGGLTACMLATTAIVYVRDSSKYHEEDLDVCTLVFRTMMAHLDNPRQIAEKTFLGLREPCGYTHVIISESDKSFLLFFKTTSDLSKAKRIARSAFMSLDGCDIVDNNDSDCGMDGFKAVSEARDELYRVFVYQNPHTMHIRVYVYVQTLSQTGRIRESV